MTPLTIGEAAFVLACAGYLHPTSVTDLASSDAELEILAAVAVAAGVAWPVGLSDVLARVDSMLEAWILDLLERTPEAVHAHERAVRLIVTSVGVREINARMDRLDKHVARLDRLRDAHDRERGAASRELVAMGSDLDALLAWMGRAAA